jgi:hypothetical protein
MTKTNDNIDWRKTSISKESIFSKILDVLKANPKQSLYIIKLIVALFLTLIGAAIYFGSIELIQKLKIYIERKSNDLSSYWKRHGSTYAERLKRYLNSRST